MHRQRSPILILIASLALLGVTTGCESKDDGGGGGESGAAAADGAEGSAAGGGGEEGGDGAPAAGKPIAELFGDTPGMIGPCAKLAMGSTMEEAKSKADEKLFGITGMKIYDYEGSDEKRMAGVRVSAGKNNDLGGVLGRCTVKFSIDQAVDVKGAITKAWPDATEAHHFNLRTKDDDGNQTPVKVHIWFNPEQEARALYWESTPKMKGQEMPTERTLQVQWYMPLEAFLGAKGDATLGFEGDAPVLGKNLDALKADYPNASKGSGINVPPVEWNQARSQVMFAWGEDGASTGYRVAFQTQYYDGAKDDIMAALEERFGAGTPSPDDETVMTFPPLEGDVPVAAKIGEDAITLAVGDNQGRW